MRGLRGIGQRLLSIADDPSDDDDLRLRKRVGVAAGLLTIVAPLSLPIQAQGNPASFFLAGGLSVFSAANLVTLSRTGRFARYVVALIVAGTIWVPLAHFVGGGVDRHEPRIGLGLPRARVRHPGSRAAGGACRGSAPSS